MDLSHRIDEVFKRKEGDRSVSEDKTRKTSDDFSAFSLDGLPNRSAISQSKLIISNVSLKFFTDRCLIAILINS